ncbi:serine hydrolase domain-containing protein [Nonomuraea sp. H19]|uniref:serine hydrolase domain-containing protein n=1 Tax=Nonomuraea sp. H19 TaxID=3452206 RepID=UPI003F8C5E7A
MIRARTAVVAGLACATLLLSTTTSATAASTGLSSSVTRTEVPTNADVQQAINELAKRTGVVGIIAEAYYDGRRVAHATAGSRLLDGQGGTIPSGSQYRAWSQTKFMTATVLLQLVHEGKLDVDDKLSHVLPVVAEQGLVERADEITVRQLIQHTSGIPDYPGQLQPFDTSYRSPLDLVQISRKLPRRQAPGEKFAYSNTNYVLLGLIIEKLTGRTLGQEYDRRLFTPLNMTRTYLPTKPTDSIKEPHGHGYHPDEQGKLRDADEVNATHAWAAGGVISTARDLSAFFRAFQQGKLLRPELKDIIFSRGQAADPARCADPFLGAGPGSLSVTSASPDGRLQLAVSATVAADMPSLGQAIPKVSQAVLCPTQ